MSLNLWIRNSVPGEFGQIDGDVYGLFRFLSCNYEIYISRVIFFVLFYNYIRTHATIYVSYGNTKARCVRSLNHLKPSDSICRIRQLVDRVIPYMRDGYSLNKASYHARRLLRVANPTRVKLCYMPSLCICTCKTHKIKDCGLHAWAGW